MLRMTVRQGRRVASWKMNDISSRALAGVIPSTSIEPWEIEVSPAMSLRRVDLPQPEGPMRLMKSPAETSRETSLRTVLVVP